jgi:dsRNA-specific ribonuclease
MEESKFGPNLAKAWKLFFPPRNGQDPELFVNRNFDSETLNYAPKAYIADNITNEIVGRMRGRKFMIIECCAGIGGNTLSFLNHPQIYGVKSYERDVTRRLYLKRNIMAYDLGDKSIVPDIDEVGVTGDEDFSEYREAVFYFDPPWLPNVYKGGVDYKDHYICKNMKVGNLLLEQWMIKHKDVASMMVFRVPPGCVIEEVAGWTIEIQDLKNNGLLYFCYNNVIYGSNNGTKTTRKSVRNIKEIKIKEIPFVNEGGFGRLLPAYEACKAYDANPLKSDPQCKVFLKYSFVDPDPPGVAVKHGLTEKELVKAELAMPKLPTEGEPADTDNNTTKKLINLFKDLPDKAPKQVDSAEWAAEYQQYIYKLLLKIWPGKESICQQMVEEDMMHIWIQAVTHESYDIDPQHNYESFEFLGDSLASPAFNLYVYNKYEGKLNRSELTNLKQYYLSKPFQAELSNIMKLPVWIRQNEEVIKQGKKGKTIHISEDLSESFYAALNQVADLIKPGLGFLSVRKFTNMVFDQVYFKDRYMKSNPKTTVMQWFQKLKYNDKFTENKLGSESNTLFQIVLDNDLYEALQRMFPRIGTKVIAEVKSTSLKAAEAAAWEAAQDYLESIGMDDKTVEEIVEESKLDRLREINPTLVKLVESRIRREGMDSFTFEQPRTLSKDKSYTALLIGFYSDFENGKKVIKKKVLGTGTASTTVEAKLNAMANYKDKI